MATGRLEVICGPMFSGKTTELLRRLRAAEATGERVIAFKPALDHRSGAATLATHGGDKLEAKSVGEAADIARQAEGFALVGVDEAHFFGRGLVEICRALLGRGLRVIVAGLERDHRGEPFEPFPVLLCEADEVVKLAGPCAVCGAPAIHSQRMVDSSDRIVVGGAEAYQARCRACFVPGR